nr:hypothetical protein CFP56_62588 [Quercus suber]
MWFCGFHDHTRQSYDEEWYAITVPDPEASPSSFNSKKLVPLSIPKVLYNNINRADYHAVLGSHLYSFGGQISTPPDSNYGYKEFDNYSTEVWALDTTHPSDHWKPCPPMTRPRFYPPATVLDDTDVWFKGTVDTHSIYGKRERICDRNHRLHHICDRKFCLLIRSTQNKGKGEEELKNYYLYCLILDVSTIYEDEEWQLSISIVSVQKYDTSRYFNMLDSLLM